MIPVSAETMAKIDKRTVEEYGISSLTLMENAGIAVAEYITSLTKDIEKKRICVMCGKGNNGGDGFVASRYLSKQNPELIKVYTVDSSNIKTGPARTNYELLKETKIELDDISSLLSDINAMDFAIVIDSIFGTGFCGEIEKPLSEVLRRINAFECDKYAVDVPSGLDATTGSAARVSFMAKKTITFGLPKKGFYLKSGPMLSGHVVVKNIGFPLELINQYTRQQR